MGVHPLTNAAVRKLAHFGEYCLLGFGYTLCLRVYTRHYIRHISWPLLLGLLVANANETLQWLLASGRDGNLKDVWIDFMGCSCGVLCAICLLLIVSLMVMHCGRRSGELKRFPSDRFTESLETLPTLLTTSKGFSVSITIAARQASREMPCPIPVGMTPLRLPHEGFRGGDQTNTRNPTY